MQRSRKPIKTTPATDQEIQAVLKESGVESLDEIPPGTQVSHSWGEFFAASMSDLVDRIESVAERDRLRKEALASGQRIDAAFAEDKGEGRTRATEDAFDAHMELLDQVVNSLRAQEGKGHG